MTIRDSCSLSLVVGMYGSLGSHNALCFSHESAQHLSFESWRGGWVNAPRHCLPVGDMGLRKVGRQRGNVCLLGGLPDGQGGSH